MGEAGSYLIRYKRVAFKTNIFEKINRHIIPITVFPSPQFFNPGGIQRDDEILEGRELVKGLHHLEGPGNSQFSYLIRHFTRDILSPVNYLSRIRSHKTCQQIDQRGLS